MGITYSSDQRELTELLLLNYLNIQSYPVFKNATVEQLQQDLIDKYQNYHSIEYILQLLEGVPSLCITLKNIPLGGEITEDISIPRRYCISLCPDNAQIIIDTLSEQLKQAKEWNK